jgi:hypothetical protein
MTKTITALTLSLGLFGSAQAAPPGKGGPFKGTSKVERISSMKPGDRYVLVCTDCKSATVGEITEAADAEKLCHDGGTIHCDGCNKKVTIKRVGPPGKEHISKVEVKYLNSEGKECMVLIPLKE